MGNSFRSRRKVRKGREGWGTSGEEERRGETKAKVCVDWNVSARTTSLSLTEAKAAKKERKRRQEAEAKGKGKAERGRDRERRMEEAKIRKMIKRRAKLAKRELKAQAKEQKKRKKEAKRQKKEEERHRVRLNKILARNKNSAYLQIKSRIRAGFHVDARDEYGHTALMVAARTDNVNLAKLLIKSKASVNMTDKCGMSALMWAAQSNHVAIAKYLVDEGKAREHAWKGITHGLTSLMIAARAGHLNMVRYLIESQGRELGNTMVVRTGQTALMMASINFEVKVVRFLVERAIVHVDHRDVDGATALFHAVSQKTRGFVNESQIRKRQFLTVRCLIEAGNANVKMAKWNEVTSLHMCVRSDCLQLVKYLIMCQANVNARDKQGESALILAARGAGITSSEVLKCLCANGARIEQSNDRGETALLAAALGNHRNKVEFLVRDCGANVDAEAVSGDTALISAAGLGHVDIVEFLLTHTRADHAHKNNHGKTAIEVARDAENYEIVALLQQHIIKLQRRTLDRDLGCLWMIHPLIVAAAMHHPDRQTHTHKSLTRRAKLDQHLEAKS